MNKILRIFICAILAMVLMVSSAFAIQWTLEKDDEWEYATEDTMEGYNYRAKLLVKVKYTTDPTGDDDDAYTEEAPSGEITLKNSEGKWLKVIKLDQKDWSQFRNEGTYTLGRKEYTSYYYDGDDPIAEVWLEGVLPVYGDYIPKFTLELDGIEVASEDFTDDTGIGIIKVVVSTNTSVSPLIMPMSDEDTTDAYASFYVKTVAGLETANDDYAVYITIPVSQDISDENSEPTLKYEITTSVNSTTGKRELEEEAINLPYWLDYEVLSYDESGNLRGIKIFYSSDITISEDTVGAVRIGDELSDGWEWTSTYNKDGKYSIGWNVTYSPNTTPETPSALNITEASADLTAYQGNDTGSTTLNFNAATLRRLYATFSGELGTLPMSIKQDYKNGVLTVLVSNATTAGEYSGTMTVTDNYGQSDTVDVKVTINPGVNVETTDLYIAGIPTKPISGSVSYTGADPVDWYVLASGDSFILDSYDSYSEYIEERDEFKATLSDDIGLKVDLSANPVIVSITLADGVTSADEYMNTLYSLVLVDSYRNESSTDITFSVQPLVIEPASASVSITAGFDYTSQTFEVVNPGGEITIDTDDDDLVVSFDIKDRIITVTVSADHHEITAESDHTVTITVTDDARGDDALEIPLYVHVYAMPSLDITPTEQSIIVNAGVETVSVDFTINNPLGSIEIEVSDDKGLIIDPSYADGKITVAVSAGQTYTDEEDGTDVVLTLLVTDYDREDDATELTLNVHVNPLPALTISPSATSVDLILDGDPVEITFGVGHALGAVTWTVTQDETIVSPTDGEGTSGTLTLTASDISQGTYKATVSATDADRDDDDTVEFELTIRVKRVVKVGALSSIEMTDALNTAITQAFTGITADVLSIADDSVTVGTARTLSDISSAQSTAIAKTGREAAIALPEVEITQSGIYTFAVNLDSLDVGTKIYLSIASGDNSEVHVAENKYAFFNSNNEKVSEVPEDKYIVVAVYIENAGTYSFVITYPVPFEVSASPTSLTVYAGGSTKTATFTPDGQAGALTWTLDGADGLNVSLTESGDTAILTVSADESATGTEQTLTLRATDAGRTDYETASADITVKVIPTLTAEISEPEVTIIIGEEATSLTLTTNNEVGAINWTSLLDKTGPTLTITDGILAVSAGNISQGTYTATITATDTGRDEMATATVTLSITVKRVVKVGSFSSVELTDAQKTAIAGNFAGITADVLSIADDSVTVGTERTSAGTSQTTAITSIGRKAALVLPEVTTTLDGIYTFAVSLDELDEGTKIYLSIVSDDESEIHVSTDKYAFFNDDNEVIYAVPENKHVTVAVYLENAATYSFVVTVSDPLSVSPSAPSVSVRGARETKTVTLSADNPAGVITWSFGDIPEGITVDYEDFTGDTLTLTISADSTDTFTSYTVNITATDAGRTDDATAMVTLTVHVIPEMSVTISAESVDVTTGGDPASVTLSVNYAAGTVTWTVSQDANGPLVEALNSTGETTRLSISANGATPGEYEARITATDSGRDDDEAITTTLTITVKAAPVIQTFGVTANVTALEVYAGGAGASVTLTASNSLGTVSWSTGTIPDGLEVTPTTGTGETFTLNISALNTATEGGKSITVTATDDGRTTDNTRSTTITVSVKKTGGNSRTIDSIPVRLQTVTIKEEAESNIRTNLSTLSGVDENTEVSDIATDTTVTVGAQRLEADVSEDQIARIFEDGQEPVGILPEVEITVSKIYTFLVDLTASDIQPFTRIYLDLWKLDASTGSAEFVATEEGKDYVFLNEAGEVIDTIPESKKVTVAAYLEGGNTYSMVITANTNDNAEGPGDASGGCSAGFGALAVMLALPLFIKRRDA